MLRILLIFLVVLSQSKAQEPVFIGVFEEKNILKSTQMAFDSSGNLNFDKATNLVFYDIESNKLRNAIPVVWLKFALKNTSNIPQIAKLKLFDGWCEQVDVYCKSDIENSWKTEKAGMMVPLDSLGNQIETRILERPDQITIRLEANETKTYFLKYHKAYRPYLNLNLTIYSLPVAANFQKNETKYNWMTAAFMAIIAGLSLFNLLYFFILKDAAYFYYSIYGFSAMLAGTVMDDYCLFLFKLFYEKNTSLQPYVYMFTGSLSSSFYMQFSRSYLHTRTRFPLLDKMLIFLIVLGIVMAINAGISFYTNGSQYATLFPFSVFMALLGLLYFVQMGIIISKKDTSDMFLMAGIGLFLLCILPNYVRQLFDKTLLDANPKFMGSLSMFQLGTTLEMLLFALGLGYRTRQLKIDKQHYEELDTLKTKFFTNISHEFRTPLMLIKGPITQLRKSLNDGQEQNLADLVENNANKLLKMINEILDLSKLEAQKMDLDLKILDVIPFLKGLFYSFESLAADKKIKLQFDSDLRKLDMAVDKDKLESIFVNLITNAIKYTHQGGVVNFIIKRKNNNAVFNVIDTGIGLSKQDLDKIFERFYRASDEQEHDSSFGIGLALVKELVSLHKGKISVKSKKGEGSDFEVKLPIRTAGFEKIELSKPSSVLVPKEILVGNEAKKAENHILLIEDNAEVRAFIKMQLEGKYQVSEAENGIKGIKRAKDLQPDLIISDVMMPGKSGYEVTATLKSDIKTSHIPIILLTAKASQKEKTDGLEMGADAYLTKPFELHELEIRIENLIKLRRELRSRFAAAIQIKASEVTGNSVDQQFMEKLMQIIEENIPNEDFTIEHLGKEIGLSTRQLSRKLKALINQTPNDFIKSIRLQRAAELLKKDAGNVSDIAFKTGFSSTAYFVANFKKQYGMPPGEYKKQL
ncbi:response regulator [Lacihabitans sp. LS3-19]|uniref:ATP-binding protein n=1 Tax=Lacihabitans sp. LS3-19 TaxID=2487335 RepID=UPI0020CCA81C|nr:ATP-binding protein [Lacihabitans sp. LS3-19]MCP9766870.1 response regulator [Lacihabitans sp. LS3-19]